VLFNYVSRNAEKLLGHPLARWFELGLWQSLIHPDDRDPAIAFCAGQTSQKLDHEFDYRIRHQVGHYIWLRDIVNIVMDGGEVTHRRGVMIDVSETKRLEADLKMAKEQAEAADAAKARFLAHMGHELRTPLNGILGMTQVMQMRNLPADLRQIVNVVDECGNGLLRLVDNVLHVSRASSDDIVLNDAWFSRSEIMNVVRLMIQPEAEQRDLTLEATITDAARGRFLGDAARVQ
jgi:PAS domain S-box-containing protein